MIQISRIITFIALGLLALIGFLNVSGYAEGVATEKTSYPAYNWSFSGVLGSYDLSSVQRGYLVYRKACASCHSIEHMRYADLQQMGLSLDQIDKVAKTDQILDGKDAQGKDHYRPATVVDFLPSPYPNVLVAQSVNMGKTPLDLSRYAMTVDGQANYIMAILLGYTKPPADFKPDQEGLYYNQYFPGHQIAMRPPLTKGGVKYTDGANTTIEQQAKDVATFLSWTAHPHLIERHRIGIMALIYVAFIAVLTFIIKRKVWSNVK